MPTKNWSLDETLGESRRRGLGGPRRSAERHGVPLEGALELALTRIRPDTQQPRKSFSEEGLAALQASIQEYGVLQPLVVRYQEAEDIYVIVIGERRWRAAQAAGTPTLPVIVTEATDAEAYARQMAENTLREPMPTLDTLIGFRNLMDQYSREELRQKGWTGPTLTRWISVASHPDLRVAGPEPAGAAAIGLWEYATLKGIRAAYEQVIAHNREAGESRGRPRRLVGESAAAPAGPDPRLDAGAAAPPAPGHPARTGAAPTLTVARRAQAGADLVQTLDGWLTALTQPAGQTWLTALDPALRDALAGKLATLLQMIDPAD